MEELKGVNEDLDMENKRLSQEVEQKEDELVLSPFRTKIDYRMCYKINWPMRRGRLRNWRPEELDLLMTMSLVKSWRPVKRK